MHYLNYVRHAVDKTHPHLGNLAVMAMLTIKAKKLLLVVAPRGCGKSRIANFIGLKAPDHLLEDRLSVAGLGRLADEIRGFQGVVVVDDIAKAQTPYARLTTITALAELVYGHSYKSAMADNRYKIEDFYGSAVVNIQPILLKVLVQSDEWEASVQDKSIRYYHLYRPRVPNPGVPDVKIEWGNRIEDVKPVNTHSRLFRALEVMGDVQWTRARQLEHLTDLLRAAAALDKRNVVTQSDLKLVAEILRPLLVERLIVDKRDFESDRVLDANSLAILTEFVTYGQFSLDKIAYDYKISRSQCYRLMNMYSKLWVEVSRSPTIYAPSAELREELVKIGLVKYG